MGVEGKEERDEEMVSVPERFEGLLADARMGCGVHQHHAKEHDVAGDASRLSVMNLDGGNRTNLCDFDVVEVDIVSGGMEEGVEEHRIS